MDPDRMYGSGARAMQESLQSGTLANHIATKYVTDGLSDQERDYISKADCFFLASATADGRPDCSYKGGLPGFVHVLDSRTLRFPSYDGNGMHLTLGNIMENAAVGLLFIDFEGGYRLRLNGRARVLTEAEVVGSFPGAEAVVEVLLGKVFENCPRYVHSRVRQSHSPYCPAPGHTPPIPEWKRKPEYADILGPLP